MFCNKITTMNIIIIFLISFIIVSVDDVAADIPHLVNGYGGTCSTYQVSEEWHNFTGSYWTDVCRCKPLYDFCHGLYCNDTICDWDNVIACTSNITLAKSYCSCQDPSYLKITYVQTVVPNGDHYFLDLDDDDSEAYYGYHNISSYIVLKCYLEYGCKNLTVEPYNCIVNYDTYTFHEYKKLEKSVSFYHGFAVFGFFAVGIIVLLVSFLMCIMIGRLKMNREDRDYVGLLDDEEENDENV